ncbi:MAG: hypothetical protein KA169_03225 [Burkholderiaceae bacterium]|nr:hypothetical protein [Burkholderiaceae bacterium]
MREIELRDGWRWMMFAALGTVLLAHVLSRSRSKLSDDDAAVYGSERERMQDA